MTKEARLTFAQREGALPVPEQLKPKQLSTQLRALLWGAVHTDFSSCEKIGFERGYLVGAWREITRDYYIKVAHLRADKYDDGSHFWEQLFGDAILNQGYLEVLDLIEWLLRHPKCSLSLRSEITAAFVEARSAYRVQDGDTIVALSSEQDAATFVEGLKAADRTELHGVRTHLKCAASELRGGNFAASVRESIHSVEALLTVIEPGKGFDAALAKLETQGHIHKALRAGFAKLYGFASDERGIRHSLGDTAEADVDEHDAIYMLGACSAFVSYLVGKARDAGLLKV